MSIITETTQTGNDEFPLLKSVRPYLAKMTRKLIAGEFGYLSSTRSTHTLGREAYKHHKNTSLKTRNRVGKLSDSELRKFITRAVVARLAASKDMYLLDVPVVWDEISHVSMTDWREVPTFLKFAWYISAYMKDHGKRYCAITLNLGKDQLQENEDWGSRKPEEIKALKNRMRERLKTAIPEQYERMFTIELDKAGRPHIHGIVFNCTKQQLEIHRQAINKAGGKWVGNNSKHQLVIKDRQNFDDAIGWMSYSTKDNDNYVYVPQNIKDNGKAHYIAAKQKIEAIQDNNLIASKSVAMKTDNPQETKVLEEFDPTQSNPENIRHQNLKTPPEPAETPDDESKPEYYDWGSFS